MTARRFAPVTVFVYQNLTAKERLEAKWKHATANNVAIEH